MIIPNVQTKGNRVADLSCTSSKQEIRTFYMQTSHHTAKKKKTHQTQNQEKETSQHPCCCPTSSAYCLFAACVFRNSWIKKRGWRVSVACVEWWRCCNGSCPAHTSSTCEALSFISQKKKRNTPPTPKTQTHTQSAYVIVAYEHSHFFFFAFSPNMLPFCCYFSFSVLLFFSSRAPRNEDGCTIKNGRRIDVPG